VVERRAREHDAVDQRDREAGVDAVLERAQRAAGGRAVDQHLVADARLQRRDHGRLAVVHEAEVADERLVEDRVDRVAVVEAAVGDPAEFGSWRLEHCSVTVS
jgi:hypothetical protein